MALTTEQVLDALSADEPNYKKAAELGPDALPHLEALIKTNPLLAAKATYLASLIQDEGSVSILMLAAKSSIREVRVTAAHASRNLRLDGVNGILNLLKNDPDEGVRIKALKSIKVRSETG
jgi:HEAT repeat protein